MKQVVIINGRGGVGKDTFIDKVNELVPCANYSSVERVKLVAKLAGWNGEKDENGRKFLHDIKTLINNNNEVIKKDLINFYTTKFMANDKLQILFFHIREPEEIDKFKKIFNAKTILIKNNFNKGVMGNYADDSVDDYNYDYHIYNTGSLAELGENAQIFVEDLMKG